jgi:hypothetical protein
MASMLKKDAKYICDVVYSFKVNDLEKSVQQWLKKRLQKANRISSEELKPYQSEFSTTD